MLFFCCDQNNAHKEKKETWIKISRAFIKCLNWNSMEFALVLILSTQLINQVASHAIFTLIWFFSVRLRLFKQFDYIYVKITTERISKLTPSYCHVVTHASDSYVENWDDF